MTPDLLTWAVLSLAAFGAGVLNAIAGGGTFLTFPALVWAGVPPIAANATSALAVCPGYLGGALGFRRELAALPRALLAREVALSAAGGVAGALLLLVTPAKVFAGVVPWLLLLATALFAAGPRLARWAGGEGGGRLARWRLPTWYPSGCSALSLGAARAASISRASWMRSPPISPPMVLIISP